MKRAPLIAAMLISCLAVGSISMATAKPGAKSGSKLEVSSKISLTYTDPTTDPYGQSAPGFSGKVRAKKGCSIDRKVKIKGIGKTKTTKKGTYSVPKDSTKPGTYQAKLNKRTIKDGKQTIVCKAAESKSITVS